jgi:DNA polymerase III psi subunit
MFIYSLNEIYNPNPIIQDNKSSIEYPLIIYVGYNKDDFPPELELLLTNILKALKLSFTEILVIYQEDILNKRIRNVKNSTINKVVSFGIQPQNIGFNVSKIPYEMMEFKNTRLILADDLAEIKNNSLLKQKLWIELQKMFGLK